MLFRKRKEAGNQSQPGRFGRKKQREIPGYVTVEYDMMKKGADSKRHGRTVRQFGVMMHGSIRLVTSGDTVDQATYEALVAAGAVDPLARAPEQPEDRVEPEEENPPEAKE